MSLRIKTVVDRFVEELKEALEADIQDRMMKEREMQSYIQEREREVAEREAAWKAQLSRQEAEIGRQEARLKMERENLEKEKSVLMGTAHPARIIKMGPLRLRLAVRSTGASGSQRPRSNSQPTTT